MRTIFKVITVTALVGIVFVSGQSLFNKASPQTEINQSLQQAQSDAKKMQEVASHNSDNSTYLAKNNTKENIKNLKENHKQFDKHKKKYSKHHQNTENKMKYHWNNADNNLENNQ